MPFKKGNTSLLYFHPLWFCVKNRNTHKTCCRDVYFQYFLSSRGDSTFPQLIIAQMQLHHIENRTMDDDLYKYIYRSVWLIILPQRFIIGKNFPINSKISIDNDKDIPESSNEIKWKKSDDSIYRLYSTLWIAISPNFIATWTFMPLCAMVICLILH